MIQRENKFLSPHEEMYNIIQTLSDDHTDELHPVTLDPYHLPYWLETSLPILDYVSKTFPSDESIMEIMSMNEPIWEDHHYRSSFLSNTSSVNHDFGSLFSTDIINTLQNHILLQAIDSKGNLCNITQKFPIDISSKPGTIEHVHIGQNCSAEESEA